MPLITPATAPVGMVRQGQTGAQQAIARIAGPMPTGKTLIKRDGTWYCKQYPSQNELAAAEHYFLGGHEYQISNELYDEIHAALDGTACDPVVISLLLYPSPETFPSDQTFTGFQDVA